MTRRLPFCLTPLPGESLLAWLHAYAARLEIPVRDLADTLDLPSHILDDPYNQKLTDKDVRALQAATGLSIDAVTGMLSADRSPAPTVLRAWAPQPTSRFCGPCLAATDGHFRPEWRLRLTFFCLEHARLLAERCPRCGRAPTAHPRLPGRTPSATHTPGCGHDLSTVDAPPGVDSQSAAQAQKHINDLLAGVRDPGTTPEHRDECLDHLGDLTLIAMHLAANNSKARPAGVANQLDADTLTHAVEILHGPHSTKDDDPLAALLIQGHNGARPRAKQRALPQSWTGASPALTVRIAAHRDPLLAPTTRLRHCTTVSRPTSTSDRGDRSRDPVSSRVRKIPDCLWPAWALRLGDALPLDPVLFRCAAAVALLLPGSDLELPEAISLLNGKHESEVIGHQLRRLAHAAEGTTILRILTELAQALDGKPVPIDYARRRHLASTTELIDPATWEDLARGTGLRPGNGRRLEYARCYLYELITDGNLDAALSPYHVLGQTPRAYYHEFVLTMPASLIEKLADHAQTLLADHGVADEPLQWHPPADWTTVTDWPGIEPDHTDPAPLRHTVIGQRRTPALAAEKLGISVEHLRYVLRRHPAAHSNVQTLGRQRVLIPIESEVDRTSTPTWIDGVCYLDPGWLVEQYHTHRRSLVNIANEIGCNPGTLRGFAETNGIPRRPRTGPEGFIPSNSPITSDPSDLPEPLRTVLASRYAHQRLQRLVEIANSPSIGHAARNLGVSHGAATQQLATLERICGRPLIQRRSNPRPIAGPTPLGEQLCQQAREHLGITPHE
jgi:hypothetical protein